MRFRTFVALEVSPFCRDRLRGVQEQLVGLGDGVRWVEPSKLHLTLVFLGEVDEREVVGVCRTTSDVCAAAAPFNFTLSGIGAFPNPRRPRTLIAQITEGAADLSAIHASLEAAFLDLNCYRKEERAFTPHVTLGRVKGPTGPELSTAVAKFARWSGGQTSVRELRVLASELRSDGPEYTVLGRAKLGR